MFKGRKRDFTGFRIVCSASPTLTRPSGPNGPTGWGFANARGSAESYYQVDYSTFSGGWSISYEATTNPISASGPAQITWTLTNIPAGTSWTYVNTGSTSGASTLEVICKVYVTNSGVWEMDITSLTWTVDGVVRHSEGPQTISSGIALSPATLPMIGCGVQVSSTSGLNPEPVTGCNVPNVYGGSSSGFTKGGYAFRNDAGSWIPLPVNLPPVSASGAGTVSGSVSDSMIATSFMTLTGSLADLKQGNATVWSMPGEESALIRMNPEDYEHLVVRAGGFPGLQVNSSTSTGTYDCTGEGTPTNTSSTTVLYAPESVFLSDVVGTATDPIESVLGSGAFTLAEVSGTEYISGTSGYTVSSAACSNVTGITIGTGNFAPLPYLSCAASNIPVYVNTWLNPHWSLASANPPDTATTGRWTINGSPVNLDDYWHPARQQWAFHPSLPGSGSQRRINVKTEPWSIGGLYGLWKGSLGYPSPWGIGDFYADPVVGQVTTLTLDSGTVGRWSFPGGSGSASGASITLSAGTTVAEFALGGYTSLPYQLGEILTEMAWSFLSGSNVASAAVSLVSFTGEQTQLSTMPGSFPVKAGNSTTYGGSWAEDFGQGYLTDTYTAAGSGTDESVTIVNDPTWTDNLGSPPSRAGQYLRITIVPINAGLASTVPFPVLTFASFSGMTGFNPQSRHTALLTPNGPGLRYGALSFWDPVTDTLLSTPNPEFKPQYMCTAGDWFSWKRPYFLNKDAQDSGFDAEVAAIYDSGIEYTMRKHFWRDESMAFDTHSFIAAGTQPVGIVVQSYRAVPPHFLMPQKARTQLSNWQDTGTSYVLHSYSHSSNEHMHVAPGSKAPILDAPTGGNLLSAVTPPSGWSAAYCKASVTNSEPETYKSGISGSILADVRPWRGFFFYGGAPSATALGYDVSKSLRHARVYVSSGTGTLSVGTCSNTTLGSWVDFDTGVTASAARCRWTRHAGSVSLGILYGPGSAGGAIHFASSSDEGRTLGTPMTIATGTFFDFNESDSGIRTFFWLQPTTSGPAGTYDVWSAIYDQSLTAVRAAAVTNITGIDNQPIACRSSVGNGGSNLIGLFYSSGGTLETKWAPDALTFS